MYIEYQSLVILTLVFLLAWFPASIGKWKTFGSKWIASNRNPASGKTLDGWAARCDRAHNNLKENFPAFVAAVLVLGATNKFDHSTGIICVSFVVARIAHFISYGLGHVLLRGIFFFIGLACNMYLLMKIFI